MKAVASIGFKYASFLAVWFLFVYTLSWSELYAGAGAALLSILALEVALRNEPLCFRPRAIWLKLLFTLPGSVIHDLLRMAGALLHRMRGGRVHSQFRVTRFSSESDTPRECARRALAVGLSSVSPNSVVIGIDEQKKTLLYHELVKAPVPDIIRELREDK